MPLSYQQISKILRDYGFHKIGQKGSHQKFSRDGSPHSLHIPEHKELAIGTAKNILSMIAKDLGITIESLQSKYNLKL